MTHIPPSSDLAPVRGPAHPRRSAGRAAFAWAVISALMSLYWAAGGLVGGETLGAEIGRLAHERDGSFVAGLWAAVALKALAATLALALVEPWGPASAASAAARTRRGYGRRDHPLRRREPRPARPDGHRGNQHPRRARDARAAVAPSAVGSLLARRRTPLPPRCWRLSEITPGGQSSPRGLR
jgi:hypothetical protein